MRLFRSLIFLLMQLSFLVLGDGVDWINPQYVIGYLSNPNNGDTSKASRAIVRRAANSARYGPFFVTKGSISAPSGNKRDYLSWAPYHWPACNWCKSKENGRQQENAYFDDDQENLSNPTPVTSASVAGLSTTDTNNSDNHSPMLQPVSPASSASAALSTIVYSTFSSPAIFDSFTIPSQLSATGTSIGSRNPTLLGNNYQDAAARPGSPARTTTCTPSPTTSIAPSATWTMCPYKAKDGKVNPDRNQLYGLSQLNAFAQATIDNSIASAIYGPSDEGTQAVELIDAFLLHPRTGVLPNLNWGQTLRGPSQTGSYMGVLDFRVMVKVANAVQILRLSRNRSWTAEKNAKMIDWTKSYIDWLQNSEIGKRPRRSANNHSTFYYCQLAALKLIIGDETAALNAIQAYFSGPFREQVVSSGEQPFECTRAKPFHYRAFNLEAMVAIAKIADNLGSNMWNSQTRYGSTIKTAIDFLMTLDPGQEDPRPAFPLVAAAMAVYGDDDKGSYRKFLEAGDEEQDKSSSQTRNASYKSKSWWFYNQPSAFRFSRHDNRRDLQAYTLAEQLIYDLDHPLNLPWGLLESDLQPRGSQIPLTNPKEVGSLESDIADPQILQSVFYQRNSGPQDTRKDDTPDDPLMDEYNYLLSYQPQVLHPDRPGPFTASDTVELDVGIFVFWEQIRHLYEQSWTRRSARRAW
ncbi:chondroitin AC/alginate lyase [Serendipita vermifera]|nr:chondroitin AC/alginate lyase [Serendipita vermifera]